MKYKLSIGILIILVCGIMLMPNGLASPGPNIWWNQATLSNIDSNPSQDPENSGYFINQVAVWEEWNGNDWDIHMKYNPNDGALGFWVFSVTPPAFTAFDEINPAVAMSRTHPATGPEVHVVYQLFKTGTGNYEIYHTWTITWGLFWTPPVLLSNPNFST